MGEGDLVRWSIICWLLLSSASTAQEFFGTFSDGPEGVFTTSADRPRYRLTKPFIFNDPNGLAWEVPSGTEVDGASIPQFLWSIIGGPFSGNYLHASIIHDHYCRTKSRMAHDTHRNFYYGMKAKDVENWMAKTMYWAVSTLGPQWKLEKKVTFDLECAPNGTCTMAPKIEERIVESNDLDLQDPEVLAVALAKFHAVARTMKTTDGETLDIVESGEVAASIESIEQTAANVRQLIATREYRTRPKELGILVEAPASDWTITKWADGKVPRYDSLIESSAENYASGRPFKLDEKNLNELEMRLDLSPKTFDYGTYKAMP